MNLIKLFFIVMILVSGLSLGLIGQSFATPFSENPYQDVDESEKAEPEFRYVGRFMQCTATLIAPDVALTAAHCLPPPDFSINGFGQEYFYLGANNPYGEGRKIAIVSHATTYNDFDVPAGHVADEYDFGLIFLAEDVGNEVGYAKIFLTSEMQSSEVRITGYPRRNEKWEVNPLGAMKTSTCTTFPADVLNGAFLGHKCSASNGTSGASMFTAIDGEQRVVGIHTAGAGNDIVSNLSLRITGEIRDIIQKWIDMGPPVIPIEETDFNVN